MIHTLTPYPAYKDSGVPWLGEVPAHWEVVPSRALFTEVNERNYPTEQLLSVTISKGVILQADLISNSSKKDSSNEDKSNYKLVRSGDIVYNKMRAWQGAVGVSQFRGIVSPAYVVVHPRNKQNPNYFHYLLRTPSFAKEAERWSYGITSDQWSLRPEHFKMIYCSLPPLSEQSAIVRYLDYMDRRIRRYIHSKQKLIKLLEEQKQAIIHRAVTRGLDPDIKLRDSGVEWLGDVPEHWEIVKLGFKFRCTSGSTPSRSTSDYFNGNIPWVRTGELVDSEIYETKERITSTAIESHSMRMLPVDTLLIAMYGQGQTRGRTGLLKIEATINQACLAILPNPQVAYPKYLQYWFISQYSQLRQISESRNTTQPNLNGQMIQNQWLLLPPLSEQADLIANIRHNTQQINFIMNYAYQEIALLREYRTRLISDLVTGKLDVRAVAANLPDEVEETEMLEDEVDEIEGFDDEQTTEIEEEDVYDY